MIFFKKNITRKHLLSILGISVLFSVLNLSCDKEVSVTPPDKPPPSGFVFIKTKPEGFHIFLNGKSRRRATSDSLTWLTTGTYKITLKKDLYRDTSFTVDILEGEKRQIFVDYTANRAMLGTLECRSNPKGAYIYFDGKYTDRITPALLYRILPGHYYVRFRLQNHRDDSVLVTIRSSERSSAYVGLVDTTIWSDYTPERSGIFSDLLTCINVDKNDNVWIGSENQGIIKYDGSNWQRFTTSSTILPSNFVNCISFDDEGKAWIGTEGGLAEFNGSPNSMVIYTTKTSDIPVNDINSIATGKNGVIWLATSIGLIKSWLNNGIRKWYVYTTENSKIPDSKVNTVIIDNSGKVWAGTQNGGIYTAPPNEAVYNRAKFGLPSDNITSTALAEDGTVWFTHNPGNLTGAGLSYYSNGAFTKVYDIPNTSKLYTIFLDRAGARWVGSGSGLILLNDQETATIFNKETTGLSLNSVYGVAQDSKGNIWIAANGTGLILYKNAGK